MEAPAVFFGGFGVPRAVMKSLEVVLVLSIFLQDHGPDLDVVCTAYLNGLLRDMYPNQGFGEVNRGF